MKGFDAIRAMSNCCHNASPLAVNQFAWLGSHATSADNLRRSIAKKVVVADGLDDTHAYIGSATLDGKPLDRAFLRHEEIMAGGELRFTMQAEPNRECGTDPTRAPYLMSAR